MRSKKHIALFFCLLLISFGVLFSEMKGVKAAEFNDNFTLNLSSAVTEVDLNNNFSINISMQGEVPFFSRQFNINYDTSKLKFVNCITDSDEKVLRAVSKNGQLKLSLKSLDLKNSGTISLNFKGIGRGNALINIASVHIAEDNNRIGYVNNISLGSKTINVRDKFAEALERIVAGKGSINDFNFCGIKHVTSDILQFVNEDLAGKSYTTKAQVQARIDECLSTYTNKLQSLNRVALGSAGLRDYQLLGINNINEQLYSYANADMAEYKNGNLTQIKARINSNLSLYTSLYNIIKGTASINDYKAAGVTSITDYSLYYVNVRMKNLALNSKAKIKEKADSIISNLKQYTLKGTVNDSKSSAAVSGVTVKFKTADGKYLTKNGTQVQAVTDSSGKYSITLPEGTYSAETVKSCYSSSTISINANPATISSSFNIRIVRIEPDSVTYRAELTWSNTSDLDSHLDGTTSNGSALHVSYGAKTYSENGKVVAQLDTDDRNGYGPEKTTFTADYNGTYTFSVTHASVAPAKAVVKLYRNNSYYATYNVPNKSGNTWTVFRIHNGQVTTINTVS